MVWKIKTCVFGQGGFHTWATLVSATVSLADVDCVSVVVLQSEVSEDPEKISQNPKT